MLAVTVPVVVVVPVPPAVAVGVRPIMWVYVLDAAVAVTLSLERLVHRDGMVGHRHEGSPG
jgi:hypothetical protein